MLLNNVKADWLYINRVDDNGSYRLQFYPNDEQIQIIKEAMDKCAKDKGLKNGYKDLKFFGGYKKDEVSGRVSFNAKANQIITKKDGSQTKLILPVFNKNAQRFKDDEVPSVENGALVSLSLEPYYFEYMGKKGVSLGLKAVQLIDYKEYIPADANPFVDVETGFKPEVKKDEVAVTNSNNSYYQNDETLSNDKVEIFEVSDTPF